MAEWHTFTSEGISVYSVEERPGALYLVTHTSMLRNLETKKTVLGTVVLCLSLVCVIKLTKVIKQMTMLNGKRSFLLHISCLMTFTTRELSNVGLI